MRKINIRKSSDEGKEKRHHGEKSEERSLKEKKDEKNKYREEKLEKPVDKKVVTNGKEENETKPNEKRKRNVSLELTEPEDVKVSTPKAKKRKVSLIPIVETETAQITKTIEIKKEAKKDREIYQIKREKMEDDKSAAEDGEIVLLRGSRKSESPEKQVNVIEKKRVKAPETDKESDGEDIILLHGRRRLYSPEKDNSSSQKLQELKEKTKRVVRLKHSKIYPSSISSSNTEIRQFSNPKENHEHSERKRNVSEEDKSLAEMVAKRRSREGLASSRTPILYINEEEEEEKEVPFSSKRTPIFYSDQKEKRGVPFSSKRTPIFYS